ncbi:dynactin subunit, putative [Pediculus humanus corporis]|uniref:Dynactin subunit 4 n=1 Tax=Pediculus humanus subsp. corporis TaxID=121224 RepID=E0VI59_PEDHC|nr:dynactin subunit, putative [Pediculus humanus corporis]EEB13065.1 dynactin subunit, putative [Pediculus humanus corporis]
MAFFSHKPPVRYVCTCGELKSITRIYFCRHCSAIRCGFCVSHEVDARYCHICLENLPVAEAWMKKNCCSSCINCPICQLNLSTRATTVKNKEPVESTEKDDGKSDKNDKSEKSEKSESKKLYYLCCFNCHWTSRDVGIPDQTSASSPWPEFENPHMTRLNELMEYYKAVSLYDKTINEKKQPSIRRSYAHLTGMSAAMVRRKAGFSASSQFSLPSLQEAKKPPKIKPSIPVSNIKDLPEEIFTASPDLKKITTLEQRLGIPGLQCENIVNLKPCKKLLLTKRSQRCRECEHNVTKPEFYPSSIKFKIQLSAYYHIPNISIKKCEPLQQGKESDLYLHLINPTPHQITVNLLPFDTEIKKQQQEQQQQQQQPSDVKLPTSGESENSDDAKLNKTRKIPLKIDYLMKIEPRPIRIEFTGNPLLPESPIILPGRDDAAEYDDNNENQNFNDDKKVVVWRKGNQAVIKFPIQPLDDLKTGDDVSIGFVMCHTYINTIIQDKSQQKINHQVKMVLTAGTVE